MYLNAHRVIPDLAIGEEALNIILSMSTFTYAIILGFSLTRRHKRLNLIKETLRDADATMLVMNEWMTLFPKNVQRKFKSLLEAYLISQLDYKLSDFRNNMPTLNKFRQFLTTIPTKGTKQQHAYEKIGDLSSILMHRQKTMEYLVNDRMPVYEWGSLIFLCITIWIGMLLTPISSLIPMLLMGMLASIFLLLLLVLKDLDDLTWRAKEWIWIPLFNLFSDLSLVIYIPEPIVGRRIKRSTLAHLKKYRLATYPKPYPNIEGKKVVLIKNK